MKKVAAILLLVAMCAGTGFCQIGPWPDAFDPGQLRSLHIQMVDPLDWDVIRFDTTFDIEKPAYLC